MFYQKIKYLIFSFLLLGLVLGYSANSYARDLDPPQVTCIEVLENGEVTIYWRSLDMTVLEFKIFYSSNGTDWSQAGSVESQNLDMQFTVGDQYVNANEQLYYFYITGVYPSTEVDSEVYNTMFLVSDNSTQGTATLLWNTLGSPPPEGSDTFYHIYYSIHESGNPNNWELLADDVTNTLYNFIIPNGICLDSINFKIEVENTFGCTSVSNIAGNWYSETIQPEKPVFDSVSIYNDEYTVLGWTPSISVDAFGTVIYRYESGIWTPIDTIRDNITSRYIDSSYQACGTNIEYAIASIDSCGILSPGSFQTPLRPILLLDLVYEICSASVTLSWESYLNASPELEWYEIWVSIDNGPDTLIDQVPATQLTYTHINVDFTTDYTYFIRAKFGNKTSTSCRSHIKTGSYIIPQRLYLVNSSVLTDNTIELTAEIDLEPNTSSWELFRSDAGGGNYTQITTFNRSEVSSSNYTYADESADAGIGFYQYYLDVYDSCGFKSLASNIQKTVFLTGNNSNEDLVELNWNYFEGFDAGVKKYYIYRFFDEEYPGEIIDSVDPGSNQYSDNISSLSKSIISFNYYIAAAEDTGNAYGYQETSFSNIVSFYRDTEFYLPNAFRPSGTNSVFKPVTTGFAGNNYLFQIFNRWGQLIFETNDYEEGWDGTVGGTKSPQGTYVYRLTYSSVFNKPVIKQGSVTLID